MSGFDIAGFIAPMTFPAENLFQLAGAAGDVEIRSRLDEVRMLDDGLLFQMSLVVVPPVASPPKAGGSGG